MRLTDWTGLGLHVRHNLLLLLSLAITSFFPLYLSRSSLRFKLDYYFIPKENKSMTK